MYEFSARKLIHGVDSETIYIIVFAMTVRKPTSVMKGCQGEVIYESRLTLNEFPQNEHTLVTAFQVKK